MPKLMAPPTTTTARLTRGEAGRCAQPLSLEPLKLEDGDHTGVEESPAEQRHTSSSTTTFARPPVERRHPSSSTTTSPRPPAERRHPLTVDDPFSSATGGATAPSWLALHIQAQRFKSSIDRRRPHRCGDAEVQLGDKAGASRSSPAPTRRCHHCEDTEVQPDDEAGASRSSPAFETDEAERHGRVLLMLWLRYTGSWTPTRP
ncbi:hypothetical protein PVAP13_6KG098535 [Panicum virgatum]|uniref:Uncharacterized protein n=1 Tax=Panicum virgatum TaxID=38727 RepID=A0A8T0R9W3_PANVG|nr:hypothetical protein PVAP13_6KG098535 [Panicum virgatum]